MKDRFFLLFHYFLLFVLPYSELKNLLKTTPYLQIRNKIWKKLGNKLGEGAYINNSIMLLSNDAVPHNVILGERVALAPNITFITSSYPNNSILTTNKFTKQYCKTGSISIGDDSWIGTGTIIHPGIKIGKCCIIGSMSNVTKNIPDFSIAFGNPVRIVKEIPHDLQNSIKIY